MSIDQAGVTGELKDMSGDRAGVTGELRDKIKSKMDVAKFFAGFISLLIGIVLKEGNLTSLWSKFGIVSFVFSLAFCIAAMFAYDHMLWPKNYWIDFKTRSSSEETFQDRLREEMLRSWWWLFLPAVGCFGLGFFLLLVRALGLQASDSSPAFADCYLWVAFVLAFIVPILFGIARWPRVRKSVVRRQKQ